MKKILVVTVYNSENCGSFWQAFALKRVLEKEGYKVFHYKRKTRNTSHSFAKHVKYAIGAILKGKFGNVIDIFKRWFRYDSLIKEFNICDKKSIEYENIDTVIIGSDTLWNFDDSIFVKSASVYLGNEFIKKRVFTYAISAANTSLKSFSNVVNNAKGLNLDKCLVRDYHTYDCLKTINYGGEIVKVCDPTFLIKKSEYLDCCKNIKKLDISNILIIYYFGNLSSSLKEEILRFAVNNKLKIVSILSKREWCDYSIPNDPLLMINYFSLADYVFTNTFHGCAFSINFQKKFAVFNEGKNKVKEILCEYKCENHLFNQEKLFAHTITQPAPSHEIIDELRSFSLEELKKILTITN